MNMKIKPYLLASALCVMPFAASAADLPVKAPYSAVAPFSWTGFYVGGSAGYLSQNATQTDLNGRLTVGLSNYGVPGHSGLFGVNAGYNYQMNAVVVGLEADIAFAGGNNSNEVSYFNGSCRFGFSSKLSSLSTVRGRLGYAVDRALIYGTAGWAYGHVKNDVTTTNFGGVAFSESGSRSGWTAGGGLEYALTNSWTVRAEGLYVDLGTKNATDLAGSGTQFAFKNTYTLGRLGLNYRF
jgi:outer membrane immunogenic protein